ncbi:MAG TPA: VanW family protein [Deinococcales bacterium]|nr:VanW family protein [Deinococcales bacterium]
MKRGTAFVAAAGALLAAALIWGGVARAGASTILPGVKVEGIAVGGLTNSQASVVLRERLGGLAARPVTVRVAGHDLTTTASALGWRPDYLGAASASREFGHGGAPWTVLAARLEASRGQVNLPLPGRVDRTATAAELARLARPYERPGAPASIGFSKTQYVVRTATAGTRAVLEPAIAAFAADPAAASLDVSLRASQPAANEGQLRAVVDRANLLVRPLKLVYPAPEPSGRRSLTLSALQVADLFYARPHGLDLDPVTIGNKLQAMADNFDRPAQNARLTFRHGHARPVPERAGWVLDVAAARAALGKAVLDPAATAVTLPVRAQAPTVTVASLPAAAALKVIASATTHYKGSSAERSANVEIAASRLDGTTIGDGQVFSFNAAIGKIAPENGFQSGLIISNGRTVAGLGGGVCQVSTTTFRAMYRAGLPVVERNQHAYVVHWYDPELGFDAAVYQPTLDLKMRNDTGGPLVVHALADHAAGTVTVYLLGTPTGRKVIVAPATILSTTPHPAALLQSDPSLPKGVSRQVDWAADGLHTLITRKVFDGAGERTDKLETVYRPWRAVYLVGTGG